MKFKLIVITAPDAITNEIGWIEKLFVAGLQKLHVRKPSLSKKELRNYLLMIPRKYHSRVVIHSHYSLLKEFSLGGLHLTEKSRKKKLSAYYDKRRYSLSASFHSIKDVDHSRRKYDYIFLSPMFDSISKKGYKSVFTDKSLHDLPEEHRNIVALGGINDKTVREAQRLKFSGAATLGFIWEAKDPVKAFNTLRSKIK